MKPNEQQPIKLNWICNHLKHKGQMKRLSLFTEFDKYYKGSDLQKIVSHKPLPFKYTINGTDCYFYNADLFGLFEWKIKKDGLTTNDFIDDYKKGFEAGLLHLKTSERIELKDLKSKDLREGTISQLQYILFEREFKTGSKGLLDLVFNKLPLIFTEKTIYDFGYWNGIIYSIDELCEKAGLRLDDLKALPPQQSTKEDLSENTEQNNYTVSTIEDWLFEFKERNILTEPHYTNLVNALTHYFENGAFPKLKQTIKVGRVNKKLLGWHLNRIFHSEGKGVEIDLLSFAKASISTFKDVEFDEKDIQNSNLYKYFTTKTK